MNWQFRRYVSQLWDKIAPGPARTSAEDQAEKLAALAQDIEKYLAYRLAPFENDGIRILTVGAACPTGWAEDTAFRDHFLRGPDASGGSINGTGGADAHVHDMGHGHTATSNTTGAHVHTINADGTHDHGASTGTAGSHSHTVPTTSVNAENAVDAPITFDFGDTSTDGSHSHTISSAGSHSHGGAVVTGGEHSHIITVNNHVGNTGSTSNVPVFRRVLVCKRL